MRGKLHALVTALAAAILVAMTAMAQVQSVETEAGTIAVTPIASGLVHPWGMAFLPDGRLLVTERPGRLRILGPGNTLSEPLAGTPEVFNQGQGGLLDVALDPDFESNHLVYLSFAESGESGVSTAVGRGRLDGNRIAGFEVFFRQRPKVPGPNHFGGRIVFSWREACFSPWVSASSSNRRRTCPTISARSSASIRTGLCPVTTPL